MKASITMTKIWTNISAATIGFCVVLVSSISFAQQGKRVASPNDPHAKRSGHITQLASLYEGGLPPNESPILANATIISPCRIITNYHVAFGKSQNAVTKKTTLLKNRVKGHVVNFEFDLDTKTSQYKRAVKAKVVGSANYIDSRRGMLGDMAVLELETCLDQKEYEQLDLLMAESTSDVPVGTLKTVSASRDANGKNQILVQEGCSSQDGTPIDGLFIANCEAVAGMSGSAVYEMGADKKWHWTGLTMVKSNDDDGSSVLVAINAKTIASFFQKVFGEVPIAAGVLAQDRQPQSDEQTAMLSRSAKPRTVVR